IGLAARVCWIIDVAALVFQHHLHGLLKSVLFPHHGITTSSLPPAHTCSTIRADWSPSVTCQTTTISPGPIGAAPTALRLAVGTSNGLDPLTISWAHVGRKIAATRAATNNSTKT